MYVHVLAVNRGPSKPLQPPRVLSHLQGYRQTSIHPSESANPLLCCSELGDSAHSSVVQAAALSCLGGVIRGLGSRAHFSDLSGWIPYFSVPSVLSSLSPSLFLAVFLSLTLLSVSFSFSTYMSSICTICKNIEA